MYLYNNKITKSKSVNLFHSKHLKLKPEKWENASWIHLVLSFKYFVAYFKTLRITFKMISKLWWYVSSKNGILLYLETILLNYLNQKWTYP